MISFVPLHTKLMPAETKGSMESAEAHSAPKKANPLTSTPFPQTINCYQVY